MSAGGRIGRFNPCPFCPASQSRLRYNRNALRAHIETEHPDEVTWR